MPTWEYPEKKDMFKYYPQFYHKTDKVIFTPSPGRLLPQPQPQPLTLTDCRTAAPFTSSSSAVSI